MSATDAGARRIVVGVTGSVSAYKAPFVIRLLRRAGHEVEVVATAAALRFIGGPALAAVSGGPVATGLFDDPAAARPAIAGLWQRQTPPELTLETVFGHAVKKKILPAGENEVHFFPRKT